MGMLTRITGFGSPENEKYKKHDKVSRPIAKMNVRWQGYDCIIQKLRYRDKIAKLKPNYNGNPMPYDYFWVDFNQIGF